MTQPVTTGTLFDNDLYDPTNDPTVQNWNGQGGGGNSAQAAYDAAERMISHGIDQTGNTPAFASVRAPAWHNLGPVFDHPVPAMELLEAAHGRYTVYKVPDFAHVYLGANGDPCEPEDAIECVEMRDPRKMKTVRQHPETGEWQTLGTVSPTYQVHQNEEAFVAFGDALIDVAEPNVATAGVLRNGAQAFMCWKLPRGVLVGGVDATEWWLLVRTSHDLSVPLTAAITPLRTVCQNTVRWNLGNAISTWSIRHTRNSKLALIDARTSLKLSYAYAEQWDKLAEQMIEAELTTAKFDEIICKEFGPSPDAPVKESTAKAWDDKRGKLLHLFTTAETQENIRGTAWAGVQAVTEFCDWETPVNKPGGLDVNGYRFLRSLTEEKSVTAPKAAILRAVAGYAGISLPKPVKTRALAAV